MLAVSMTIFSSCGKLTDLEPKSEFYVKLKVNGGETLHYDAAVATTERADDDDQIHRLLLMGHRADENSLEASLVIDLYSTSPFTAPRTFKATDPVGLHGQANITWSWDGTVLYNVLGPANIIDIMQRGSGIKSDLTVTITAIDEASVRGTFSGVAIGTPMPQGDRFFPGTITEGEFYVPLVRGD